MDIHRLFENAKESLLKNGDHAPTLTVENADSTITLLYFADLPDTTQEKKYMLFGCGRKYGKEQKGVPLLNLYFISECWMSFTEEGKDFPYNAPHEDPKRREAIMIIHLDSATGKSTMHHAEILRHGETIDLLPLPDYQNIDDNLLPYFLAGFLSAEMSDAELAQHLTGQK